MTRNSDTTDGLNDLAAAASRGCEPRTDDRHRSARRGVPNGRVLTAGGIVLRALGVVLILFGFWPFLWTILEALMLLSGSIESQAHFQAGEGGFAFRLRGWPAILFGLTWSGLAWCAAVVAFAFGHALYAVRDLVEGHQAFIGAVSGDQRD